MNRRDIIIPPQSGVALTVKEKGRIKVIDIEGGQVSDLLAFLEGDPAEKLSTAATIDNNGSLSLDEGDFLYSNRYRPILKILEDTVGKHDLLHPACSPEMYSFQYGLQDGHPSCFINLVKALKDYNIGENDVVTPLNIFMNTEVDAKGQVKVLAPLSKAGDYLLLEARANLIVAITACSVEESACNSYRCTAIGLEIEEF